jgi:hypothetical protein
MLTVKPKLSLGSFVNEDDFITISEFMNHPQFKNPVDASDRKRVIRNTLETMYKKYKNPNETRGRKKKVELPQAGPQQQPQPATEKAPEALLDDLKLDQ